MQHLVDTMQGFLITQLLDLSWAEFQRALRSSVRCLRDLEQVREQLLLTDRHASRRAVCYPLTCLFLSRVAVPLCVCGEGAGAVLPLGEDGARLQPLQAHLPLHPQIQGQGRSGPKLMLV